MAKSSKLAQVVIFLSLLVLAISWGCTFNSQQPTPQPTNSVEPTLTPTSTPTPTPVPTPTQPPLPSPTIAPTPVPSPASNVSLQNQAWVHFIDVGQGDASLVILGNGTLNRSILIDAGKRAKGADVVAFVHEHGVTKLHAIIMTNPDEDHVGGFLMVLRDVPVLEAIHSGTPKDTQTYKNLTKLILEGNVSVTIVRAGDFKEIFPGINLTFLNPSQEFFNSTNSVNDRSAATKVSIGGVCLIFPGDSEKGAEQQMVSSGISLRCQALKAGHHGSRTSSSLAFVGAVSPEIAIISAGINNSYGHPHVEALRNLASVNATIYRTDAQGSIFLYTNGSVYSVSTQK